MIEIVKTIPSNCVAIPSKGRAGKIKALRAFANCEKVVVVEPKECGAYFDYLNNMHSDAKIMILPANDRGIVFARNEILKASEGVVIMCDDDVRAVYGWNGCKYSKGNNIDSVMILDICNTLKSNPRIGLLSPIYSGQLKSMNIDKSGQFRRYRDKQRLHTIIAFNAPVLKNRNIWFDDKFIVLDDFDYILQVLNSGLKALTDWQYYFAVSGGMTKNKGGAEEFRSKEISRDMAILLTKKWPKYVKPQWVERRQQWEVRILWSAIK